MLAPREIACGLVNIGSDAVSRLRDILQLAWPPDGLVHHLWSGGFSSSAARLAGRATVVIVLAPLTTCWSRASCICEVTVGAMLSSFAVGLLPGI